ncbi:MAG TPA: hypothetical protein VNL16_10255 [Chloroflexota bacterium]|nr:hypothetical protein [Chloroflexota bacterium]
MNEPRKTELLHQIAGHAVPDDLDLWPSISTRIAAEQPPRRISLEPAPRRRAWRRRTIVGVAAAAALALAIGEVSPLGNQAQPVSAQAILDRAEAATTDAPLAVTSYHLRMTRHLLGKGNQTIDTEVWYGGKDHQRTDQQIEDAQGAILSSGKVIVDGTQTWIVSTESGQSRIVHATDVRQGNLNDSTKTTSLADVLQQYSSDKRCMTPEQQGVATVAGRATVVIVLHPRPTGCADGSGAGEGPKVAKGGPTSVGGATTADTSVAQVTVWVDARTFLPLRTDVSNREGVAFDHSEVTQVEYNLPLSDATFAYVPPPGATVIEVTGGSTADVKKALIEGARSQPGRPAK